MPLKTSGADPFAIAANADQFPAGELIPRWENWTSSSATSGSGVLNLTYFTAARSEDITTMTAYTAGTAAAATPTLCRMGIYSIAGNGDLTLIASTPNDTTLWAAINTAYPKALSATFSKVAGTRYAAALICVTGAATPVFTGSTLSNTAAMGTLMLETPRRIGRLTVQTDLATPITAGTVVSSLIRPGIRLS